MMMRRKKPSPDSLACPATAGARAAWWPPEVRRRVRGRLLRWYGRNRRDLPWRRRGTDAYAQLLAEFMLQQTQVGTVIDYYTRFISRFPTVTALAEAPLDEVLTLWSGLGYYARARNLHAAAQLIVERYGGVVPASVEQLMELPGIGRYTAGAIASIAYGVRAPVLDGNVARVLLRLAGIGEDPKVPGVRDRLWAGAEALLPAKRCGDFNQALMELGATVCVPRSPDCARCPLSPVCGACRDASVDRIPPPGRRPRVARVEMVVAAVLRGREYLFVQRPARGLWAGLWELPSETVRAGESEADALHRMRHRLPRGSTVEALPCASVNWQLTHRRIRFSVYRGTCGDGPLQGTRARPAKLRWISPADLDSLAVSNACREMIERLEAPAQGTPQSMSG